MEPIQILWGVFWATALVLFVLDIRFSASGARLITGRKALLLCSVWVSVATAYGFLVGGLLDATRMLEFFTAYVVEYSLSVDNMFVFLMIFSYFNTPPTFQPKILTWGILGAVLMRLVLIFTGVRLIAELHWIIYVFGLLLIYTALKVYFQGQTEVHPEKNPVLKLFSRFIPLETGSERPFFLVRKEGRWHATPLLAALIVIESSDLVFAVDSIPAVLAISSEKLIVYTSNVFAVVGLRSLYFLLASIAACFRFLKTGVSLVLFYVGVKMMISGFYKIPAFASLLVVLGILMSAVLLSLLLPVRKTADAPIRADLRPSDAGSVPPER
jgi:tellurite resistance protein TerC